MLLTEWDTEEAKKVWYEDGWDDGHIEGRETERQFFLEMIDQGLSSEEIKERLIKIK